MNKIIWQIIFILTGLGGIGLMVMTFFGHELPTNFRDAASIASLMTLSFLLYKDKMEENNNAPKR